MTDEIKDALEVLGLEIVDLVGKEDAEDHSLYRSLPAWKDKTGAIVVGYPSEAELIGLLLLELDGLTKAIRIEGPWAEYTHWEVYCSAFEYEKSGGSLLTALTAAVRAAKEGA